MSNTLIKITKDCIGHGSLKYNSFTSTIQLFEGEVFEKVYSYNYFRSTHVDEWNTTQPVIGIFNHEKDLYLLYELDPNTYISVEDQELFTLSADDFFERSDYASEEVLVKEVLNYYKRNFNPKDLLVW